MRNIKGNEEIVDNSESEKDKITDDSVGDISSLEFDKGIEVEKEHIDDEEAVKKIVEDHLKEIPDYYTRLQKMEEDAKAELLEEEGEDIPESTEDVLLLLTLAARQDRKAMGMNPEGMDHVCSYCQRTYDDISGEPIRQLTPEEYATVQSHGICGECMADQMRKLKEYKAQQASKLNLTKKAIDWPWDKKDAPEE